MARSLTWDQGREMARHADVVTINGIDVYFAEPHHPRQRVSNEAFNGLLRRYLRYIWKGTDLTVHSQSDLHVISHPINIIPRLLHHWESTKNRYDAAVAPIS